MAALITLAPSALIPAALLHGLVNGDVIVSWHGHSGQVDHSHITPLSPCSVIT